MYKGFQLLFGAIIYSITLSLVKAQATTTTVVADEEFYKDPIYDKFFFARNIVCTTSNCPSPNVCVQDNAVCKCAAGMANHFDSNDSSKTTGPYCKYERKKQLTAFLIQFFIFCGAGQFYAGNISFAVPQLIICLAPCALWIVQVMCGIKMKKVDDKGEEVDRPFLHSLVIYTNFLISIAFFGWWLADAIIFGTNGHLDSNGIPLFPW